ncbi:MAG: S49 family peptidase [Planctomycetaceae bacterium]|nr:S49 family peptidase [Planctomycetaceae bacterium]
MKYRALASMVYDEPWVILPRDLHEAAALLRRKRRGGAPLVRATPQYGQATAPAVTVPSGVAILPLTGTIVAKSNWFIDWIGGTALEKWVPAFRSLVDDSSIETIILNIDSPGGQVVGTPEAANVVFAARGKKRLIAVVNNVMCSGAYWIGSACDEIVGGPSSVSGSIGAIQITAEYSKYFEEMGIKPTVFQSDVSPRKGDGNEYEKLTKEATKAIQGRLDGAGQMFVDAVAKHRGISSADVLKNYGQGAWMYGSAAKRAGLVDRLATLTDVLIELGVSPQGGAGTKAAAARSPKPEEANMDKIIAALVEAGVLAAGATEVEAKIALKAYFGAVGQAVPDNEAKILAGIAKIKAEQDDDDETEEDEEEDQAEEEDEEEAKSGPTPRRKVKASGKTFSSAEVERIADERVRQREALVAEIRAIGTTLLANGLDPKHIDTAISTKKTLQGARAYFAKCLAEGGKPVKPVGGITFGESGRDVLGNAIGEILEQRCLTIVRRNISRDDAEVAGKSPTDVAVKPLSAAASDLRHKRLIDLVELSFQSHGIRVDMSDPAQVMQCLFGLPKALGALAAAGSAGNYAGPSAFPNILSNIMGKSLQVRLEYAPTTYRKWCAQYPSVTDFKPRTIIGTGEYQELPRKNDNMPREQAKPFSEEPAWISVEEYGDVTPFTFRMLVDDDLGVFLKSLGDKTIAADRTLNRLCVNLLTGNALAPDGNVLFDDTIHKNLVTPGTAPTAANMEIIDALLMAQKGLDGERTLALTAAFLLHPNKHKHAVRKELSTSFGLVPTTKTELNVFRDVVEPIWEPMLTDADVNAWYWGAAPNLAPAIYYSYMVGYESPKVTQNFDWNTNVVNFATDQIFGVAVNNWRPIAKNLGA